MPSSAPEHIPPALGTSTRTSEQKKWPASICVPFCASVSRVTSPTCTFVLLLSQWQGSLVAARETRACCWFQLCNHPRSRFSSLSWFIRISKRIRSCERTQLRLCNLDRKPTSKFLSQWFIYAFQVTILSPLALLDPNLSYPPLKGALFQYIANSLNIYFPYPNLIWQKFKYSLNGPAEKAPAALGRAGKFHGLAESLQNIPADL